MALPDPDRARRMLGLGLFMLGIAFGGTLLFILLLVPPFFMPNAADVYLAMTVGALLAFPAAAVYLTVPRLLDRYDPEPWYALLGCLLWGGVAASGFSAAINSAVGVVGAEFGGAEAGEMLSAVLSAPLMEEFFKGIGVFGVFLFLRREFDGVVDGIMYATFTAIGFAAVENVVYYARAAGEGEGVLAFTFLMRGVLAPWGHPLYTSMTGIGIGLAREATHRGVRYLAPLVGYLAAVFLHALWNGSAVFAEASPETGIPFFCFSIPLWLAFVGTFLLIVLLLVRRRGRIIRLHLEDEVALGNLDAEELRLVTSAFGLWRARLQYGETGVLLVRAAARLALHKWHATRAKQAAVSTVSIQFVAPLRERVHELRSQLGKSRNPR